MAQAHAVEVAPIFDLRSHHLTSRPPPNTNATCRYLDVQAGRRRHRSAAEGGLFSHLTRGAAPARGRPLLSRVDDLNPARELLNLR